MSHIVAYTESVTDENLTGVGQTILAAYRAGEATGRGLSGGQITLTGRAASAASITVETLFGSNVVATDVVSRSTATAVIQLRPFHIGAGESISFRIASDNAGDTSVDVTIELYGDPAEAVLEALSTTPLVTFPALYASGADLKVPIELTIAGVPQTITSATVSLRRPSSATAPPSPVSAVLGSPATKATATFAGLGSLLTTEPLVVAIVVVANGVTLPAEVFTIDRTGSATPPTSKAGVTLSVSGADLLAAISASGETITSYSLVAKPTTANPDGSFSTGFTRSAIGVSTSLVSLTITGSASLYDRPMNLTLNVTTTESGVLPTASIPWKQGDTAAILAAIEAVGIGGGSGGPFEQIEVAPHLLSKLKRSDGTSTGATPWRLRPGETAICGWDASLVIGDKRSIVSMPAPTTSDGTVADVGTTDGTYGFAFQQVAVTVSVEDDAAAGDECWVRAVITLLGGQTRELVNKVLVVEGDA